MGDLGRYSAISPTLNDSRYLYFILGVFIIGVSTQPSSTYRSQALSAFSLGEMIIASLSPLIGSIIPSVGLVSSIFGKDWLAFCRRRSYRRTTDATYAMISRFAMNRPEQYVEPPPKGLKLGLRLRLSFFRKRLGSNVRVLGPNTASSRWSWR